MADLKMGKERASPGLVALSAAVPRTQLAIVLSTAVARASREDVSKKEKDAAKATRKGKSRKAHIEEPRRTRSVPAEGAQRALLVRDCQRANLLDFRTRGCGPQGRVTFSSKRAREGSKTRCQAHPTAGCARRRVWELPERLSSRFEMRVSGGGRILI